MKRRNDFGCSRSETQGTRMKGNSAGSKRRRSNGIRLHSVRLPGLIAHQEVMFGGDGQTLKSVTIHTIAHLYVWCETGC
ncbi:dihydrodipicolinate reductase C-terminal domain-containing protein [Bacillus licheniformis]|nr:dihydrodipicolinate reductase C-terminal domain-containing protein [Bacillus licheniformis]